MQQYTELQMHKGNTPNQVKNYWKNENHNNYQAAYSADNHIYKID